jgi:hypothetical protein
MPAKAGRKGEVTGLFVVQQDNNAERGLMAKGIVRGIRRVDTADPFAGF